MIINVISKLNKLATKTKSNNTLLDSNSAYAKVIFKVLVTLVQFIIKHLLMNAKYILTHCSLS